MAIDRNRQLNPGPPGKRSERARHYQLMKHGSSNKSARQQIPSRPVPRNRLWSSGAPAKGHPALPTLRNRPTPLSMFRSATNTCCHGSSRRRPRTSSRERKQ